MVVNGKYYIGNNIISIVNIQIKDFLDESFIINEIVNKIPNEHFELIYDAGAKKINDSSDLSCFVTNAKLFDDTFTTQQNHKYVYLLYHHGICVYVGKAVNIKGRLKSHLFKCSATTNSKIEKVADLLKANQGKLTIEIVVLDVSPDLLYSAVEGILINKFNTTDYWNEKES